MERTLDLHVRTAKTLDSGIERFWARLDRKSAQTQQADPGSHFFVSSKSIGRSQSSLNLRCAPTRKSANTSTPALNTYLHQITITQSSIILLRTHARARSRIGTTSQTTPITTTYPLAHHY